MIYILLMTAIFYIGNNPIEITVDINNCKRVYIEDQLGVKCNLDILHDNCKKGGVDLYITIPEEKDDDKLKKKVVKDNGTNR